MPPTVAQEFDILLKPVSHPELNDICIDENLFPIGRTEHPFESYPQDVVADLSRRHARIFCEQGAVYLADLGSKNGTTVNGLDVRQKTVRLKNGDDICFGGVLCYKVQLGRRSQTTLQVARLHSLTLAPEHSDLGLQPVVISQFPFLVSKADPTFARYRDDYPHQVNYISRRHAHIFLKGGQAFVEDLGSTNGTFVNGKRLDEHAVMLQDDDVLAFGGHHFVYKVSVQKVQGEIDPTVTKFSAGARRAGVAPGDIDKTTFVAAAGSFLDIFCVDRAPKQEDEINAEHAAETEAAGEPAEAGPPRSRNAVFLGELRQAFFGKEGPPKHHLKHWGLAVLLVGLALGGFVFFRGASEGDVKDLLAQGKSEQAAILANDNLEGRQASAQMRALATEATLKANVPGWVQKIGAKDFDGAAGLLDHMNKQGAKNPDLQPLTERLAWMGDMERLLAQRGGPDAPIRMDGDADRIQSILKRWDDDPQAHQRKLDAVASQVPEFRDAYALAMSHLRRLQSEDAVYLPAIARLKAAIAGELERNRPEAIDGVIKEYADKYPRLGMDPVRRDLRQYKALQAERGARHDDAVLALMAKAGFATPEFQARAQAAQADGQLPPPDLVRAYREAMQAWRKGDFQPALAALQGSTAGPWGQAVAARIERKKDILAQFDRLQKSRNDKAYGDRLLDFYGMLDRDEDAWFVQSTSADFAPYRDKALARAQDLAGKAEEGWNRYKNAGPIEGPLRLESQVSAPFRNQARLLSEAHAAAQASIAMYVRLQGDAPARITALQEEIAAELGSQRRSLQEARTLLEARVLKEKLALLGVQEEGR
ncbi:FHA domain-containing protein [Noviherbaspirillum sp. 17J57-3]|uniref:FHA domain-containing protein n=2 Tax=Noviherbaspirillum galbum TaxID=2709383 RepID=A0A6B3STV3_9BURK|nr:FHA domain-containing protein [Noviherbaspirillum galbum]